LGQPLRAWRIFLGWRKSWLSREALLLGAWIMLGAAALRFPQLSLGTFIVGVAALACSAMVYIDTRRHSWRASQTFPRFFGTAVVVGVASIAPIVAAFVLLAKLAWESQSYFGIPGTLLPVTARLQRGPLKPAVATRDILGLLGVVTLLAAPLPLALLITFCGELAERHLFFRAVDAPKMPGLPA
jgi:formate dehydrogenase iron-sulfur subunit